MRRRARLDRLRRHPGVPLLAAALLLLSLATPRAALVFHQHAGGEHAHQHAAEQHPLAALFGQHHHAHAPHDEAPRGPRWATDDGAGDGHVHQQQRYDAAAATIVACIAVSRPLAAFVPLPDRPAPALTGRRAGARAPPPPSRA